MKSGEESPAVTALWLYARITPMEDISTTIARPMGLDAIMFHAMVMGRGTGITSGTTVADVGIVAVDIILPYHCVSRAGDFPFLREVGGSRRFLESSVGQWVG
jgi:hypothetical protein